MFNPSELLFTRSDFTNFIRAPEVLLTLAFAAVGFAYIWVATALA
jgi:hypothetical protein